MHYCTADDGESCVTFNDKAVVVRAGCKRLEYVANDHICITVRSEPPTDSNTAQFHERFQRSLRGEGK